MSTATRQDERRAPRILVADADADTRSLYAESLRRAGCEVVDAADGREALVKAFLQPPALVVTEMRLPVFDGYALCEVLRRDSTTRAVPILVVTDEAHPDGLSRARAAGANAVLVKPVAPDALLTEIQRLLERAAQPSGEKPSAPRQRLMPQSKAHRRFQTTAPSKRPPDLVCPSCDLPLTYERSYIGGVSRRHPEQWDAYTCPASCGSFEYRQRTRILRRVG